MTRNGKTENAERTLFITPLLKEILEPRVNENDPESLVFSNDGKLIAVATLNAHFKKICKNAGIRPTTYKKKKPNGNDRQYFGGFSISIKASICFFTEFY